MSTNSEHGAARHTDPDTSHAAAACVNVNRLEREILRQLALSHVGVTTTDLACYTSIPRDSLSPRMPSLVAKALVVDSGERRKPDFKHKGARRTTMQIVWKITDKGRTFVIPQNPPTPT